MLTDVSSATMYAYTCGTRIFTTDSASPQPRHLHRRVVVVVVVTGLSSTGVMRLPHLTHARIYARSNNSLV